MHGPHGRDHHSAPAWPHVRLPDWLEDRPKGGHSLVERLLADGDRAMSLEEIVHYVRDRLLSPFPPQPAAARRPRVRYCDTNFFLLAAIVEAAAVRPLHRVHEVMLYEPLNLRRTWMAGYSQPVDTTAAPATLWGGIGPSRFHS
jgi:CubicO group peptidase (beta-lactamase class C family)